MDRETRNFRKRIARRLQPERGAGYRLAHKAEAKAYNAAYYLANRERIAARNTAWRQAHRDVVNAAAGRRHAANPARRLDQARKYRATRVDYYRQLAREYARAHPRERAFNESQRRIRKRGNGGTHTLAEWNELRELHAYCCFYCGESRPLTRDHKVPLARGGTNDIGNIVPACRSCNSRKRMMSTREYLGQVRQWGS